MSESIKETKEALEGLNEVSLALIPILKDGVQPLSDGLALYEKLKDPAFLAKLQLAADGIQKVPAEMKDLDAVEVVALVTLQASYVPKLVEALKSS